MEVYNAPDERAKNGVRPSILAYYHGRDEKAPPRIWILTHMDVVPPGGDLSRWTVTEPFKPIIKDGKVYGRGSEDNGQSLVASLYAVRAMMNLGIRPKRTVILAFVSDEETGSKYGVEWLMKNHPELFRKDDLVLVPDGGGNEDGTFIEVAEKSILWFRVRVRGGKQVHASMPDKGAERPPRRPRLRLPPRQAPPREVLRKGRALRATREHLRTDDGSRPGRQPPQHSPPRRARVGLRLQDSAEV